mmetsp:Transcript_20531/g.42580  ORF Transcript_20531/g.42580 Transcript_20531/m.42580 type:complete len:158 (-) Transcript_20531:323-796(-)
MWPSLIRVRTCMTVNWLAARRRMQQTQKMSKFTTRSGCQACPDAFVNAAVQMGLLSFGVQRMLPSLLQYLDKSGKALERAQARFRALPTVTERHDQILESAGLHEAETCLFTSHGGGTREVKIYGRMKAVLFVSLGQCFSRGFSMDMASVVKLLIIA